MSAFTPGSRHTTLASIVVAVALLSMVCASAAQTASREVAPKAAVSGMHLRCMAGNPELCSQMQEHCMMIGGQSGTMNNECMMLKQGEEMPAATPL